MLDWQVAPAEWEIVNYDEPKVRYRRLVESFLKPLPIRSLKKKTFVSIATNVLCADIPSSKDTVDPIQRDIYLPLEISLTKWSVADSNQPEEARKISTKVWMINSGRPLTGSNKYAADQRNLHKIDYGNIKPNDNYFRSDLPEIAKEINSMLTPDRTVFSVQLRNCRQDLGCLKWLNKEIGFKMKPIKVYSLEDLYVVLIRRMISEDQPKELICQGIARFRMEYTTNTYDAKTKCIYHTDSLKADGENDTGFCAKSMVECYSHVLLNDISYFTDFCASVENNDSSLTAVTKTQ